TFKEIFKAYVQTLPTAAFLLVLVAHAGHALIGGFVAALIARRWPLIVGGIVGALVMVGGITAVREYPCPLWFAIVDLASYLPCGILGAWLASRAVRHKPRIA